MSTFMYLFYIDIEVIFLNASISAFASSIAQKYDFHSARAAALSFQPRSAHTMTSYRELTITRVPPSQSTLGRKVGRVDFSASAA